MRACSECKNNLDESQFYRKNDTKSGRSYAKCKDCFNKYCVKRWQKRKTMAVEYKGGKCEDCKSTYPDPVFDFHHLDPSQKEFSWNKMRLVSDKKLFKELDKCALLCANCHRMRHHC
jgi:hypothetical protein